MKHGRFFAGTAVMACILTAQGAARAEPHVDSVSGTASHGATLVIDGSEFGTKDPAAPLVWDDCESRTLEDYDAPLSEGGWDETWPAPSHPVRDGWKVQYRAAGYRGVASPHMHSAAYLVGGHWNDNDDMGIDVLVTADNGAEANAWYASWYVTLDPQWPTDDTDCYVVGNYKEFVYQSGGMAYTPGGEFNYTACTSCIVRRDALIDPEPQNTLCGGVTDLASTPRPSEAFGWKRREVTLQWSPGVYRTWSYDGTAGVQAYDVVCDGGADLQAWTIRSFTIGGFMKNSDTPEPVYHPEWTTVRDFSDEWYDWEESAAAGEFYVVFTGDDAPDPWIKALPEQVWIDGEPRTQGTAGSLSDFQWDYGDHDGLGFSTLYVRLPGGEDPDLRGPCAILQKSDAGQGRTDPDAFRYFDDLYVDTTWARVVLADSADYGAAATVEPQIPSAWSDASITAQANLGRLACPGTAYLFVFDAAGSRNADGFPVEISCEPVTPDEMPDGVEPPPDAAVDGTDVPADAAADTAVDAAVDTGLDPESEGPDDSGDGGCGCVMGAS